MYLYLFLSHILTLVILRNPLFFFLTVQEEQNRGKPNWEHLNEPLHVLITCEDSENRVDIKLARAREEVEKLLVPVVSGFSVVNCQLTREKEEG